MNKEICFFVQEPVTTRDYQRFGHELLVSRGFKVSYLDLTEILNPNYPVKEYPADPRTREVTIKPKNEIEVAEYFEQNPGIIGIDLIGAQPNSLFLYRVMKKYNITYASVWSNSLPNVRPFLIRRLIRRIRTMISRVRLSNLQKPAYVLVGGTSPTPKLPLPDRKTKYIKVHTLDYDLYLGKRESVNIGGRYAVFLDEYLPYHPDFTIGSGTGLKIDADQYYRDMNALMSAIEEKLGLQVVIAAHPRSRYDLQPGLFGSRKVILGQTIDLVAGSELVITHSSTAINFAVLYRKPLLFVSSRQIAALKMDGLIRTMAALLGTKPVAADNFDANDLHNVFRVDADKYDRYREAYIKEAGTPDKPFWDIVADVLLADGD